MQILWKPFLFTDEQRNHNITVVYYFKIRNFRDQKFLRIWKIVKFLHFADKIFRSRKRTFPDH